jgi:hypothetical protein
MFGLLWPNGALSDIQHNRIARNGAITVEVASIPRERGVYRYDVTTKAAVLAPELAPRSLEDAKLLLLAQGQNAPQWAKDLVTEAVLRIRP